MEVSTPGLTSRLTLPALVMAGASPLWSDPRAVVWRLPDVVSRVVGVEPLELWDEAGTTWARFEGSAGRVVSAGGWTAAVEGEGVQLTGEEGPIYLPIHAEKLRLSVEGRWLLLDEQRAIRTDLKEIRRTACRWVGSEHLSSGACP